MLNIVNHDIRITVNIFFLHHLVVLFSHLHKNTNSSGTNIEVGAERNEMFLHH
jgi:hypothetical protein